jgi:ribosomal protein L11 methyltransferase
LRSLSVRVRPEEFEAVLDRLLPIAPRGVHELPGDGLTELRFYGEDDELAETERVATACAEVRDVEITAAPDDWRDRRADTYRPERVGARLIIRPSWAPPAPSSGLIEVVLADEAAFGTGSHPTTRACLEALERLTPGASLADLGCGSGVIAVTAALLGWRRVLAVDTDPTSLDATGANAARNGVDVEPIARDLTRECPPEADVYVANVPLRVHAAIAGGLSGTKPSALIASGVPEAKTDELIAAYAPLELEPSRYARFGGWCVIHLGVGA